tara:strand:+ start:403 stop:693 length:291 start_codon:yes stop_codon:yes gene_type:complete
MHSLVKLYKFIEKLEDLEDDDYFNSIKSVVEQKILNETILKYDDENKKEEQEKEKYMKLDKEEKAKNTKEKYMKLQRERESEGEVCPRCSRRDCCC